MDGFITSTAQDVLNRRPISLERGGQSAIAGNLFAGLAGIYGRRQSNALTTNQKGELGETLGDIRSAMNGRIRDRTSKKYDYFKDILEKSGQKNDKLGNSGKYWVPDARDGDLRFEDKFGMKPVLSANQKVARAILGKDFQLNSFVPQDIGKIAGMGGAAAAPQVTSRRSTGETLALWF